MTSPVAVNDIYTANENQKLFGDDTNPGPGAVSGLLSNDFDPDNNPTSNAGLTVTQVRDSSGTTTNIVGPFTRVELPSGAAFIVKPNGEFTFDPAKAFQGLGRGEEAVEVLQYRVLDANNERSTFSEVRFTVEGRNDTPVVKADVAAIDEDATASLNVLANDSDADTTDKFEISDFQFTGFKVNGVTTSTNNGVPSNNIALTGFEQTGAIPGVGTDGYTISIDGETGEVVFEAGDAIKDALDEGDIGEITFRYRVQDDSNAGNATSDFTTVTITISDDSPTVFGLPATLFVNARNNEITGDGFLAGDDYDASGRLLLSNTDGSSNPNDAIKGTDGDDNIWAGIQGNDLIDSGDGDDVIGLGSGSVLAGADDDFVYSTAAGGILDFVDLGGGFNNLWSLASSSTTQAIGSSGGFYGYSNGDDTLTTTGGGDDFVYQINGAPTGGVKTLLLGDGNNTVSLGAVTSTEIFTGSGIDIIDLADGSHDINTGAGNDIISVSGDRGDDTVDAGAGNDYVELAGSNDTVDAGLGDDTVLGGGGNDIINGEIGNDFLYGQDGNDIIDGGLGDDLLSGGGGNSNDLIGGAGADIFVLSQGGVQVITDFSILQGDQIGLTGSLTFENLQTTRLGTIGTPGNFNVLIQDGGGQNVALVQNVDFITAAELQINEFLYTSV